MKKIRLILPGFMLIIFMVLISLTQDNIIGGRIFIKDMLIKMFIAILLIFIYLATRFHRKGIYNIIIDGLVIPIIFELCVLAVGIFTKNTVYGFPLILLLFPIAFFVYYALYMEELENN